MSAPATFRDVQQDLVEYRKRHEEKLRLARENEAKEEQRLAEEREKKMNQHPKFGFFKIWAIDLLDWYPMRLWRRFNASHPLQCWVITGCLWLTGQLLFAKIEFGTVYFMISLFMLMFLNLGVRAEGELSAYSVFNPNCQKLMGQITAKHFERDMFLQNRGDGDSD